MKALLNTSFFFAPAVENEVTRTLRERWIPACNAAGETPAVCLRLPSEEGIMRLAVQTRFADSDSAERFRAEVTDDIADTLLRTLGADSFTCFSTIMEIIDL